MSAHRQWLALYLLLVSNFAPSSMATSAPVPPSDAQISQRVVADLPEVGGKKAHVLAQVDLTAPFSTRTPWTFVAATLPGTHEDGANDGPVDGGPLAACFVKAMKPLCSFRTPGEDVSWHSYPLELRSAEIVYRGKNHTLPLLQIKSAGAPSADGDHANFTDLYSYDRAADQFLYVFSNKTGNNNNQRTRFVEDGPIRGYVIVNEPTGCCYYRVEVFRQGPSGLYVPIFHYQSHTLYGDGNLLSVSDSEMPEILRRLGLWHLGDPLPAPREGCIPELRRGELWCK